MVQVSYDFYSQTYGGTEVPQAVFEKYAYRAGVLLGSMMRSKASAPDSDKLSRLICEICDRLYLDDRRMGVSRESVDGYDVTYDDGKSCEIRQIIRQYLGDDGVLFRGRRL